MKVLIISAGFIPMTPVGPAYIAGAALKEGHDVKVFDCLFNGSDPGRLGYLLSSFEPDVAGISIPITLGQDEGGATKMDGPKAKIKQIVDTIKKKSNARIIAGGAGFNFFSEDWLIYLEIEYGLRGEGEVSFPLFLSKLSRGEPISGIPGSVILRGDRTFTETGDRIMDLDGVSMPAYELFEPARYNELDIPWGVSTKKGCSLDCFFCSDSQDHRYRLKSSSRVVEEIKYVKRVTGSRRINFSDNSFNCPITHAKSICKKMIQENLDVDWRSGTFKPLGFSREFCDLLRASGCSFVGLAMETASPRMLSNLNRGYRTEDIVTALDNLKGSGMDFGVSLVIGAPGETMTSIRETLDVVDAYPEIKAVWVNIGVFGWRRRILANVDKGIREPAGLFENPYYISPELDGEDIEDLIDDLSLRRNVLIQVNRSMADSGE
ncbi:B12-binding domain-containing radical SAM protein [Desulfospira joergensenii]|uniref:B12-binding domain-containing radical SAM protein n=1 Tax=Desulfospira joergensenii TaxID=53329 RepID=UPI0003B67E71|nr:B12-binding domain-containing radical SAM protein [Desulfospira joergensenii]